MLILNKAILHTMDSQSEQYHLTNEEIYLDLAIKEYIIKHIEKALKRNDSQKATFRLTSKRFEAFTKYDTSKFVDMSKEISNDWFSAYANANRYPDMNLLCVEYYIDEIPYFGVLQFKNKNGYVRNTYNENGKTYAEIHTSNVLLPSTSQNVDEFFFINLKNYSILYKESKRYLNNDEELLISDILLYCDSEMSMKDSIHTLNNIVNMVSTELDEDALDNTLKMKRLIKSCMDTDQILDTDKIAPTAFSEDEKFQSLLNEKIMEEQVPKQINLKMKAPANIKKHKIKTDLGIEVSIPVDFAGNAENFQIIENIDGTISIELLHIGKIVE